MEHYQIAQYLTIAVLIVAPLLCLWLPDGNKKVHRKDDYQDSSTLTGSL